jgi:toxin ParE1/3/4
MHAKKLKLRYSTEAKEDLRLLIFYSVYHFGMNQTEKYIQGLHHSMDQLCDNFELGKDRLELAEGLKSMVYGSHIIFYRKEGVFLSINRILHHSRDISKHL